MKCEGIPFVRGACSRTLQPPGISFHRYYSILVRYTVRTTTTVLLCGFSYIDLLHTVISCRILVCTYSVVGGSYY